MERLVRAGAGYTAVDPESRRVVPTAAERKGKTVVKMVYVVLEAQYQVRSHFAAHCRRCHVDVRPLADRPVHQGQVCGSICVRHGLKGVSTRR